MDTETAISIARSWRDVAVETPNMIGEVYPPEAPISYEILDCLIAVIDGEQPKGVKIPERGLAVCDSVSSGD